MSCEFINSNSWHIHLVNEVHDLIFAPNLAQLTPWVHYLGQIFHLLETLQLDSADTCEKYPMPDFLGCLSVLA